MSLSAYQSQQTMQQKQVDICSKNVWPGCLSKEEQSTLDFGMKFFKHQLLPSNKETIDRFMKYKAKFEEPQLQIENPLYWNWWLTSLQTADTDGKVIHAPQVFLNNVLTGNHAVGNRIIAVKHMCWSIPSNHSLTFIKDLVKDTPLIDMCSGCGYWSWMFQQIGINVVAVDSEPGNEFHDYQLNSDKLPYLYVDTIKSDASIYLKNHNGCADSILFVSWPRDNLNWLSEYKGDTLIWIGEIDGCTAYLDESDSECLWQEQSRLLIPHWYGIHDLLIVYRRIQNA